MARARTIYRNLHASDKFNALHEKEGGEFAQLVYLLTYPYADDWGHIPYDARWIRRTCMGDTARSVGDVHMAIECLVCCGLWDEPYTIGGKRYVYIYQFEVFQREGIRHRRRGEWPDETGDIPRREGSEDIVSSLQKSEQTRAIHAKSRKVT